MEEKFRAALIAGIVSIVVAGVSYFANRRALESKQKRALTLKLYDLRLEKYPEAFDITQDVGKTFRRSNQQVIDKAKTALDRFRLWRRQRGILIMSDKAMLASTRLKSSLAADPEYGASYSEEQLHVMWKLRKIFHQALRSDLGLMYEEDDDEDPTRE